MSRSKEAAEPLEPPDPSLLSQEWKESLAATPKQEQLLVIAFFSTFLRALVYKFINTRALRSAAAAEQLSMCFAQ